MTTANIVKKVEATKDEIKNIERYAKNTLRTMSDELKLVATYLATGIISNIVVLKSLGGTEYVPAIGAAITSSVVSGVLEKQYNIVHPIPKVIIGSAGYMGAAMLGGERIPLKEAAIMGLGTAVISEIITKYI